MHYRLRTLFLLAGAAPIWVYLIVVVPRTTGFGGGPARFVIAPLVLVGIAAAVFWILRKVPDRLAWAMFASAVVTLGSLAVAQGIASQPANPIEEFAACHFVECVYMLTGEAWRLSPEEATSVVALLRTGKTLDQLKRKNPNRSFHPPDTVEFRVVGYDEQGEQIWVQMVPPMYFWLKNRLYFTERVKYAEVRESLMESRHE
jgi:hypothetical protein